MALDLSLFVTRLSFFVCLRKVVLRECGVSWVSSLILKLCGGRQTVSRTAKDVVYI